MTNNYTKNTQSAQKFLDELKMLGKVVVRFDDYIGDITVISDREGDAIVSWTNPLNEFDGYDRLRPLGAPRRNPDQDDMSPEDKADWEAAAKGDYSSAFRTSRTKPKPGDRRIGPRSF